MNLLDHLDMVSVKLGFASIVLGVLTGQGLLMVLAGLASLSTILYNAYKWHNDKKKK